MEHTAWMGCGNSATPPSLCQSTGATASCLLSLVSLLLCSGASCLHAYPSATSGLWFPASRAVWLSLSASAASTLFASRPSAIPSLKPWARSSAVCALHCAKKSKYSHSVYNMMPYLFIHHKFSPGILLTPWSSSFHHMLLSTLSTMSWHAQCHFCHQKLCDSCSRQHGSVTALALLKGSVLLSEGGEGICLPSFIIIKRGGKKLFHKTLKWTLQHYCTCGDRKSVV